MTTIVTLGMDPASAAWFNGQRQRHYPPALNRIPAHLSLFHVLPRDASIQLVLKNAAERTPAFELKVTGVRSMGRGVLYALESPELMSLHQSLAEQFRTYLTPQDRQPLRPHVVVQNKVEPAEAKALMAELEAAFAPQTVHALGLDWWEYLGGPWGLLEQFPFAPGAATVANGKGERAHGLTTEELASFGAQAQSCAGSAEYTSGPAEFRSSAEID